MATAIENTGPAEFLTEAGLPKPPAGLQIAGHTLVAFTPKAPAREGAYAYGIGLFLNPAEGDYHTHVVWEVVLLPSGEFVANSGDYCPSLGTAVVAYRARGGEV